jgi:hypothetical protein
MNKRPYTDIQDLVDAATDQAMDEKLLPAVKRLETAAQRLDDLHPVLTGLVKRQNAQMVWLFVLSGIVLALVILAVN